jgi:hypothetical protein
MLKTLIPGTPISSNTIISPTNIPMEEEDKLRIYEFDVSFIAKIVLELLSHWLQYCDRIFNTVSII